VSNPEEGGCATNLPTHVGVDRRHNDEIRDRRQSPHACGGGPAGAVLGTQFVIISPRMWGWTGQRVALRHHQVNLPTHVGVDRPGCSSSGRRCQSPHACGGGPKELPSPPPNRKISPRMWGWTAPGQRVPGLLLNLPTHVGVDRNEDLAGTASEKSPHACGGGPKAQQNGLDVVRISPRMWGWTVSRNIPSVGPPNLPTHVGVDRYTTPVSRKDCKSPHACGGGPWLGLQQPHRRGISPRMWGWTAARPSTARRASNLPTHVGVDRRPGRAGWRNE
jgi:hypothetical protein